MCPRHGLCCSAGSIKRNGVRKDFAERSLLDTDDYMRWRERVMWNGPSLQGSLV